MAEYLKLRINHTTTQWVDLEVKRNSDKQAWRLHAVRDLNGLERVSVSELISMVKTQADTLRQVANRTRSDEQKTQIVTLIGVHEQVAQTIRGYRSHETVLNPNRGV